jgi:DNA-binding PadR family transcriptional regulator
MDTSLSRIELLVLSTLSRRPMHGYDVKLELRYRHVRWWAKCEHAHLYAALSRLEKNGDIAPQGRRGDRGKRVYAITGAGRERLRGMLLAAAGTVEGPYFDVDLLLAGSFALEQGETVEALRARRVRLSGQLAEARTLYEAMQGKVPLAALLIMEHRAEHLEREIAFTERAASALESQPTWGAFLGDRAIGEFVAEAGVELEND